MPGHAPVGEGAARHPGCARRERRTRSHARRWPGRMRQPMQGYPHEASQMSTFLSPDTLGTAGRGGCSGGSVVRRRKMPRNPHAMLT